MTRFIRNTAMTVAALGALALGGSALAGAATGNSNSTTGGGSAAPAAPPAGKPAGRHIGANGQQEQALDAATAAKVKAAALAKVPDASFERAETDVDHGSPYEAHLRKSDGTELEVLVNKSFEVTAVNTLQRP